MDFQTDLVYKAYSDVAGVHMNNPALSICLFELVASGIWKKSESKQMHRANYIYGQESESAEIGFLWGPKHEQFSNASLSALNLKTHFET